MHERCIRAYDNKCDREAKRFLKFDSDGVKCIIALCNSCINEFEVELQNYKGMTHEEYVVEMIHGS